MPDTCACMAWGVRGCRWASTKNQAAWNRVFRARPTATAPRPQRLAVSPSLTASAIRASMAIHLTIIYWSTWTMVAGSVALRALLASTRSVSRAMAKAGVPRRPRYFLVQPWHDPAAHQVAACGRILWGIRSVAVQFGTLRRIASLALPAVPLPSNARMVRLLPRETARS